MSLADQAIASASSFVPLVALARFATPFDLGIYSLVFTIWVFATGIEHALITGPYTFIPGTAGKDPQLHQGSIIAHHVAFMMICALFLLSVLPALSLNRNFHLGGGVLLAAGVTICAVLTREFLRRVCFAGRSLRLVTVLDGSGAAIQLLLLGFLAMRHGLDVRSALYAIAASTIPHLVYGTILTSRSKYSRAHVISTATQHWMGGQWLFLSTSVSAIPQQIFPWCLALFFGPAATGMLASCNGIVQSANPFLIGFTNYFGPHAVSIRRESGDLALRQTLVKATIVLGSFLSLYCLAILVFGSSVVAIVYGHRFAGESNVHTLWMLSLGVLASQSTLPLGLVLMAMDRPRINAFASIAAVLVSGTLGVMAVRLIGIEGVGLGLLLSGCAESAVKYINYARIRAPFACRPEVLQGESEA